MQPEAPRCRNLRCTTAGAPTSEPTQWQPSHPNTLIATVVLSGFHRTRHAGGRNARRRKIPLFSSPSDRKIHPIRSFPAKRTIFPFHSLSGRSRSVPTVGRLPRWPDTIPRTRAGRVGSRSRRLPVRICRQQSLRLYAATDMLTRRRWATGGCRRSTGDAARRDAVRHGRCTPQPADFYTFSLEVPLACRMCLPSR
jgi:hypothetical protein